MCSEYKVKTFNIIHTYRCIWKMVWYMVTLCNDDNYGETNSYMSYIRQNQYAYLQILYKKGKMNLHSLTI